MRVQAVGVSRSKNKLFADAERVVLRNKNGSEAPFVVLGVLEVKGQDYCLASPEEDLGNNAPMYVFGYSTDAAGAAVLDAVDDEDTYDEVLHLFADLYDSDTE